MQRQLTDFFDIAKFNAAAVGHSPCPFFVVQEFVKPEALARINRDYPAITEPGNFRIDQWPCGDAFRELIDALESPDMRDLLSEKLDIDLTPLPSQMTVRRYVARDDGHIHNDAVTKRITGLIYFNDTWDQPGGRLRMLRSEHDMDDYAVEVEPRAGNLLVFRRNEHSFHGFLPCSGERRALQFHRVDPKRAARGNKRKRGRVAKFVKRLVRGRK